MPEKKSSFWQLNKPAFLWAVFVLILCGWPGDELPELTFLEWLKPDKIVHLFLFGVQCYLLIDGFAKQNKYPSLKNNAKVFAVIFTICYGCLTEILQKYVFIHRTGDVRDAIADAIGAFIGLWIFNRMKQRKITQN